MYLWFFDCVSDGEIVITTKIESINDVARYFFILKEKTQNKEFILLKVLVYETSYACDER